MKFLKETKVKIKVMRDNILAETYSNNKVTIQTLAKKTLDGVYYMNNKPMSLKELPKEGDYIHSMSHKAKWLVEEIF